MANFYNIVFYVDANGDQRVAKMNGNSKLPVSKYIEKIMPSLFDSQFTEYVPRSDFEFDVLWYGDEKFESNLGYAIDEFCEGLTLILVDKKLAPVGPADFELLNMTVGLMLKQGGFTPKERSIPKNVKIFLSHKGVDKPIVRDYFNVLKSAGFDPWLDEDAMPAGTSLDRALLQGMKESCAAVFFVTDNYRDEDFLAAEIEHAIAEKREKKDKFSIVTLILSDSAGVRGVVPGLLSRYVWKNPANHMDGLCEIFKALPIEVKHIGWRVR